MCIEIQNLRFLYHPVNSVYLAQFWSIRNVSRRVRLASSTRTFWYQNLGEIPRLDFQLCQRLARRDTLVARSGVLQRVPTCPRNVPSEAGGRGSRGKGREPCRAVT